MAGTAKPIKAELLARRAAARQSLSEQLTDLAKPAKPVDGVGAKRPKTKPADANPADVNPASPLPPASTDRWLVITGARHHNLKDLTVAFPLGRLVCVTGVSGSGKSTLVNDILLAAAAGELNKAELEPGDFDRIDGLEHLDKVIDIDQSPIGRTPRSNPATYTKVFDEIRDLYAGLAESRLRGYGPGRFSFNVQEGRCHACEGNGAQRKDMEFLADVWTTCPVCQGRRFNRETLAVTYRDRTIADVLDMDVQTALVHFENIPKLRGMLQTLVDVGLDYIRLGQSSTTLSGGEAQRIKLARELGKRSTGRTLYVLDEPTTGLHFADIERLLKVLHDFVDAGNSVVVIEHNLDVIKTADWLIELGPHGGASGGYLVAEGTPEALADHPTSATGLALRPVLDAAARGGGVSGVEAHDTGNAQPGNAGTPPVPDAPQEPEVIRVEGARQHNLKGVDVTIPRGRMTVFTGLSGSGKTSLAMDTIYAEGQRRYVESLSSYARQFLGRLSRPAVDRIRGLSPAIAIEQRAMTGSTRSTVGTVTEIHDHLRVLWARIGQPHCVKCGGLVGTRSVEDIVSDILNAAVAVNPPGLAAGAEPVTASGVAPVAAPVMVLAPLSIADERDYTTPLRQARTQGFLRVRIDGAVVDNTPDTLALDPKRIHKIDIVVDRLTPQAKSRGRLAEAVEMAVKLADGRVTVAGVDPARVTERRYNQRLSCRDCGLAHEEMTPHHFSFNAALGWCPACDGLGVQSGANPAVLVPYPNLSISEGAIAGWALGAAPAADDESVWDDELASDDRPRIRGRLKSSEAVRAATDRLSNTVSLAEVVGAVCRHIGLSMTTPWHDLPVEGRDRILHGTGESWIPVRAGLAVRFQGLFPSVARATKLSWTHRERLSDLVADVPCSSCQGSRLRPDAAAVRVAGHTLGEICRMPLATCYEFFSGLELPAPQQTVVGDVLAEIVSRLKFLVDVGLEYLHLHRSAPTLSGGESQRIQLAGRLGSGLTGVLYVLDEPTIGLHPRDTGRLINALARLRDLGNTLVLVEHDRDVIAAADYVIDFGPGAGQLGGQVVAAGSPAALVVTPTGDAAPTADPSPTVPDTAVPTPAAAGSLTAAYLGGQRAIWLPAQRRPGHGKDLEIIGAAHNNLKGIDVRFPLGTLIAVTGVSGSGKSSLIGDILYPALTRKLHGAVTTPGVHDEIRGLDALNKVISVDQTPLGATPNSNPATYTGAFEVIREVFARQPEARQRSWRADRFSFNKPGGRCEACEGAGRTRIAMHFLADVLIPCEACQGRRYDAETLKVAYLGRNIAEVLDMRIDQAVTHFADHPKLVRVLSTLVDVGLGYLQMGQGADTLSGGESQRVRLAAELARPDTGRTLYLLDEPTTGLHFEDVRRLLVVLHRLVDAGNTVLVIEHNPDMIKSADWVIDLGPEAGARGGHVVAAGTPEQVAREPGSHTGRMLAAVLAESPRHTPQTAAAQQAALPAPQRAMASGGRAPALRQLGGDESGPVAVNIDQANARGRARRGAKSASPGQLSRGMMPADTAAIPADSPPDNSPDDDRRDDDTADGPGMMRSPRELQEFARELFDDLAHRLALLDSGDRMAVLMAMLEGEDRLTPPGRSPSDWFMTVQFTTNPKLTVKVRVPEFEMPADLFESLVCDVGLTRRKASRGHREYIMALNDAAQLENPRFQGFLQACLNAYFAKSAAALTAHEGDSPDPPPARSARKTAKPKGPAR